MSDQETISNDRRAGALFAYGIGSVLFLYFGFFAAVFLDDFVFRTHWIEETIRGVSPDAHARVGEVFRFIYAPLIWIVTHVLGVR